MPEAPRTPPPPGYEWVLDEEHYNRPIWRHQLGNLVVHSVCVIVSCAAALWALM